MARASAYLALDLFRNGNRLLSQTCPSASLTPLVKLLSGTLLVFTDGLTDSISGKNPESRLLEALADTPGRTMSNLKSLVDPKLNEDDVTILLVKREAEAASQRQARIVHDDRLAKRDGWSL